MSKDIEHPLVSIIVITYNSSKYVLDTLESAKSQTYKNIELVISDDCSTDNTVLMCSDWISKNKSNFVETQIISSTKNTGISANCNRGLQSANGKWMKFIAGDDVLLKNCINDYIDYINLSSELIFALHANMNVFNNTFNSDEFVGVNDYSTSLFNNFEITAAQQYFLLLRNNFLYIGTPTFFVLKNILVDIGGYDEKMPFEDWPMFLAIVRSGVKIKYVDRITVNYRIHNESVSNNYNVNKLLFNDFIIKDKVVYDKYRRNNITLVERLIEDFEYKRKFIFIKLGLNKVSFCNKVVNFIFSFSYSLLRKATFKIVKCIYFDN